MDRLENIHTSHIIHTEQVIFRNVYYVHKHMHGAAINEKNMDLKTARKSPSENVEVVKGKRVLILKSQNQIIKNKNKTNGKNEVGYKKTKPSLLLLYH